MDQMPLVNLKDPIEAGIEQSGQSDRLRRERVTFARECEAEPDDDLGRTEIDLARRDGQITAL
jgi:hypothetical protein